MRDEHLRTHETPVGDANEPCPRPCVVCGPEGHHWLDSTVDPLDYDPDAPPEMQRLAMSSDEPVIYWACKHCTAWLPIQGACRMCGKTTMSPHRKCFDCGGRHEMA